MSKVKKKEIELTLQQRREYVDGGGATCPRCQSLKIDEDSQWREDDSTFMSIEFCANCGLRWTAIYDLVAIDNLKENVSA